MSKKWKPATAETRNPVVYLVANHYTHQVTPFHTHNLLSNSLAANPLFLSQINIRPATTIYTWGVQVVRYPNFFSRGMEADRNVKVVGGDVAAL